MTVTESVLVSFLSWTLGEFLLPSVFSKDGFIYVFTNFRGFVLQLLHGKTVTCLFIVKT